MREDIERELRHIPDIETWHGLPMQERERRERVSTDIKRRIVEDGPHSPKPSPERRQMFMPFSALKGYDKLVRETTEEPQRLS